MPDAIVYFTQNLAKLVFSNTSETSNVCCCCCFLLLLLLWWWWMVVGEWVVVVVVGGWWFFSLWFSGSTLLFSQMIVLYLQSYSRIPNKRPPPPPPTPPPTLYLELKSANLFCLPRQENVAQVVQKFRATFFTRQFLCLSTSRYYSTSLDFSFLLYIFNGSSNAMLSQSNVLGADNRK